VQQQTIKKEITKQTAKYTKFIFFYNACFFRS
jgi:hypothetical protein